MKNLDELKERLHSRKRTIRCRRLKNHCNLLKIDDIIASQLYGEAAALGLKIRKEIRKTVVEIVTHPLYSNAKCELQEQNLKTQLINDVSGIFEKSLEFPANCLVDTKDLAGLVATNIIDPLLETVKEIDSCCQAIERLMSPPFDVEFPARTARRSKRK